MCKKVWVDTMEIKLNRFLEDYKELYGSDFDWEEIENFPHMQKVIENLYQITNTSDCFIILPKEKEEKLIIKLY